jgi:hypothetical protein
MSCHSIEQMRRRRRREPRRAIYLAVTWPRWRHKFIKWEKQVLLYKIFILSKQRTCANNRMPLFLYLSYIVQVGALDCWVLVRRGSAGLCLVEGLNVIKWRGVKPRTQWQCIITPASCLQRRVQIHKDLPQRQQRVQWQCHLRLQV